MNYRAFALAALLGAPAVPALAGACGDININQHDYRNGNGADNMLYLVETRHFNEDVEMGIKGITGPLGGDLDYTLRHFPNHPRALNTVLRLAPRYSFKDIPGTSLPIECYFERAVRFYPDDSVGWLMYARYQSLRGKDGEALSMLKRAHALAPEEPSINYNLGLAYARQKKFADALPYAQKAYAQGFPLPALKQTLIKAGNWVEPEPLIKKAEADTPADAAEPAKP